MTQNNRSTKFYRLEPTEVAAIGQSLTPSERELYLYLRSLDPFCNGLTVVVSEIAYQLGRARETISRALKKLEEGEWLPMAITRLSSYRTYNPRKNFFDEGVTKPSQQTTEKSPEEIERSSDETEQSPDETKRSQPVTKKSQTTSETPDNSSSQPPQNPRSKYIYNQEGEPDHKQEERVKTKNQSILELLNHSLNEKLSRSLHMKQAFLTFARKCWEHASNKRSRRALTWLYFNLNDLLKQFEASDAYKQALQSDPDNPANRREDSYASIGDLVEEAKNQISEAMRQNALEEASHPNSNSFWDGYWLY